MTKSNFSEITDFYPTLLQDCIVLLNGKNAGNHDDGYCQEGINQRLPCPKNGKTVP